MTSRKEGRSGKPVGKVFMLLFGLAGLGVGVWMFRRKRAAKPR
jgi:LPXTG-motif cell wall-anchored protein